MKRYIVTGPHAVHGHAPGDEFLAEIEPAQEDRLLSGGHLEVAPDLSDEDDPEDDE